MTTTNYYLPQKNVKKRWHHAWQTVPANKLTQNSSLPPHSWIPVPSAKRVTPSWWKTNFPVTPTLPQQFNKLTMRQVFELSRAQTESKLSPQAFSSPRRLAVGVKIFPLFPPLAEKHRNGWRRGRTTAEVSNWIEPKTLQCVNLLWHVVWCCSGYYVLMLCWRN